MHVSNFKFVPTRAQVRETTFDTMPLARSPYFWRDVATFGALSALLFPSPYFRRDVCAFSVVYSTIYSMLSRRPLQRAAHCPSTLTAVFIRKLYITMSCISMEIIHRSILQLHRTPSIRNEEVTYQLPSSSVVGAHDRGFGTVR